MQQALFSETLDFIERLEGQTQNDWVLANLKARGFITRNECLKRYCSRLSARIDSLKKMGYQIDTEFVKTEFGTDYKYIFKG